MAMAARNRARTPVRIRCIKKTTPPETSCGTPEEAYTVPPSLTVAIAARKARRDESVQSGERIITVIPCEAAESSPELQIRTTQLPREGSPPSGLHYFRQSCHGISVG